MKKISRILSVAIALCMVLSLGCVAFAADDMSAYNEYLHEWLLAEDEVNDTMTPDVVENEFMALINAGDYTSFPAEMLWGDMLVNGNPMTYEEWLAAGGAAEAAEPAAEGAVLDVADMEASEYGTLTNYTNRDNTGEIYIGYDVTDVADIALNETVTGAAYTSVYAHGENAVANVTGTVNASDDTSGELASDFNGQGAILVANDGATINIDDATVSTDGFERSAIIVAEQGTVTAHNSTFVSLGANPLTEAYEGYVNSANQNIMLSPPWPLGIQGGSRVVNMIGTTPTLTFVDSTLVSGGWALISTDSGSNMMVNVVDTEMDILPESKGGMDSGWRIFGYDEDAYGSGYGAYYIGNPVQNYYGVTMNGVTYAAIITGATSGLYTSSKGSIDLYDANGNLLETVEGKGNITTINGVFGVMMHNSLSDGMTFNEGTTINTADATIIHKTGSGEFNFDNAVLNSETGVIFQMIDNDDDSRIGMVSMAAGFDTTYDEAKVTAGDGFPGINYDYTSGVGGVAVTSNYTNGTYEGNIYNGTGYYGQKGNDLTVTLGEGAVLNGDIALTSTIKGLPYSAEAVEGIEYYNGNIGYILLDAEGNVTENEAEAAYIQIQSYTINEYFLQGHVCNKLHYNGSATIDVVVSGDAVWNVAEESLITGLTIEEGATVYGTLVENADGSLTITAGTDAIPAGSYGSIEAVGGGVALGGGLDETGALNVEASAAAMADMQSGDDASGEPSGEPSAEPEAAEETITIGEYTFVVYTFDGEQYIKLADLTDALAADEAPAAEAGDSDWSAYQEYLIEAAGKNAPDLDEFKSQVYSFSDWDSIPQDESPWDQLFTTVGVSTWEEFQQGSLKASAVEGAMG